MKGNLWYICRNLSKLKGTSEIIEDGIRTDLEKMESEFPDKLLKLDRCTVFKFNIYEEHLQI